MSHPFEAFMREAVALAERGRWSAGAQSYGRRGARARRRSRGARLAPRLRPEPRRRSNVWRTPPPEALIRRPARSWSRLSPATITARRPPARKPCSRRASGTWSSACPIRNPKAAGGAERLREAGVRMEIGVCEDLCRVFLGLADFLVWQSTERPYVILKLAMTLDGRIATRTGHSRWITGASFTPHGARLARRGGPRRGSRPHRGQHPAHRHDPLLTARLDEPVDRQPLAARVHLVAGARAGFAGPLPRAPGGVCHSSSRQLPGPPRPAPRCCGGSAGSA